MRYELTHITTYKYADTVAVSHNVAHLRPRMVPRQAWEFSDLSIEPSPAGISERLDFFGNPLTFFSLQEAHRTLAVESRGVVDVTAAAFPEAKSTAAWEIVRDGFGMRVADMDMGTWGALQFTMESPYVKPSEELAEYARPSFAPGRPVLEAIVDLAHRIYTEFKFDSRATTIATPLTEVMKIKRGVCQDFAHLMIGCVRSMGLAGRYVSGYVLTMARPGKPKLVGGDASHAWAGIYCGPQIGWIDVDPTNDKLVSDQHITIAWGRDFGDVSPIQGVILGGRRHTLEISVHMEPVANLEGSLESRTVDSGAVEKSEEKGKDAAGQAALS